MAKARGFKGIYLVKAMNRTVKSDTTSTMKRKGPYKGDRPDNVVEPEEECPLH